MLKRILLAVRTVAGKQRKPKSDRIDVRSFDFRRVHGNAPELGVYLLYSGFATTLQIKRSSLTSIFHEALGLDREIKASEKCVERVSRMPIRKGETERSHCERVSRAVDEESLFLAHLQHSSNHAAESLIFTLDKVTQTFADALEVPTKWQIGGKYLATNVTLIEGIRAVANWQRHHFQWKSYKESNWNHKVLKQLNLWTHTDNVPVAFLKGLRYRCYRDLERHYFIAMQYMILEMGIRKGRKAARERVEFAQKEREQRRIARLPRKQRLEAIFGADWPPLRDGVE